MGRYPALDRDTLEELRRQPLGILPPCPRFGRFTSPNFPFPADIWRSGGRERATFGTDNVVLSIHQAKLRKLVKWSPLFQGYVRSCPRDRRAEDTLLTAYAKKQAAKAKPLSPLSLL